METCDPAYGSNNNKTKLVIHGNFGDSAVAKVTVGGSEVPFTYKSDTELDCDIPDTPGDGYAGPVQVVTGDGIKSNAPSLTWWFGAMEYKSTVPNAQSGKIDMNANFRADVHKYRNEVDGDLQDPAAVYARTSVDTTADWTMLTLPLDYTAQSPMSGSYNVYLDGKANPPFGTGFELGALFDRAAGRVTIAFLYLGTDVYAAPPGPVQAVPFSIFPDTQNLCGSPVVGQMDKLNYPKFDGKLPNTLASDLSIMNDTFSATVSAITSSFSVPNMTPQYAPTDDAEEDQPN